jgi:3-dehydroquinate dehydratase / shikimate dehydrogenase
MGLRPVLKNRMASPPIFGKSRVCAVVAARTASEAQRQIRKALRYTSTIEWRLDWLGSAAEFRRVLAALRKSKIPRRATIIATCRHRRAGGKFSGTIVEQLSLLRSAIDAGCRCVDLEIETVESLSPFALDLYTSHTGRIMSYHNFRGALSQSQLARVMRDIRQISASNGFDAVKVATNCDSVADGLRVLAIARQKGSQNVIAVPMGEVAAPLRVLASRFGSALSYAPVEESTAPGQIPLAELHDLYRGGDLSSGTRVYGVIGDPIAHSLSPLLHNAGFRARKIDAIYLPFRVIDLNDLLRSIQPLGISGFSVTLPHKEQMLRHLDDCDPLAAAIGAVNTVVVRGGGKLFGYNTDYVGVLRAIERRMPIAGSRVLIVGAGGAARAVAFALAKGGALVSICARRNARAKSLAREFGGDAIPRASLQREYFDAIVNATPVGMHPTTHQSPLSARELNCRIVFDAVYRPQRTKLLQLAEAKGIETISGVEMFLAQGIAQWEIWTGMRAPEEIMRRAVLQKVQAEGRERKKT